MDSDTVLAWHLCEGSSCPSDGTEQTYAGHIVLGEAGFHAYLHPADLLGVSRAYARPVACLVACTEIHDRDATRLVCRRWRVVAKVNVADVAWPYARAEAARVADYWRAPEIVRRYLATGDTAILGQALVAATSPTCQPTGRWATRRARRECQAPGRRAIWEAARRAARAALGDLSRMEAFADHPAIAAARAGLGDTARRAARDAAWEAAHATARMTVEDTEQWDVSKGSYYPAFDGQWAAARARFRDALKAATKVGA
jgi:hypothetical protein